MFKPRRAIVLSIRPPFTNVLKAQTGSGRARGGERERGSIWEGRVDGRWGYLGRSGVARSYTPLIRFQNKRAWGEERRGRGEGRGGERAGVGWEKETWQHGWRRSTLFCSFVNFNLYSKRSDGSVNVYMQRSGWQSIFESKLNNHSGFITTGFRPLFVGSCHI